jgi:hypothetical protein
MPCIGVEHESNKWVAGCRRSKEHTLRAAVGVRETGRAPDGFRAARRLIHAVPVAPPPSYLGLLPSQPSQMSAIIFVFFGDPSVDQSSAP